MDIQVRYGVTGYIFIIILFIYSPIINDYLLTLVNEKSLVNILIIGLLGFPIGYIMNQISSFIFHTIPIFHINNYQFNSKLIPREAKKEMKLYKIQLKKFKNDFNFREWYAWRWTHLTMNMNIIIGSFVSIVLCVLINGIYDNYWWLIYSFKKGMWIVDIFFVICFIIIIYNSYLYRWFIKSMNHYIEKKF